MKISEKIVFGIDNYHISLVVYELPFSKQNFLKNLHFLPTITSDESNKIKKQNKHIINNKLYKHMNTVKRQPFLFLTSQPKQTTTKVYTNNAQ